MKKKITFLQISLEVYKASGKKYKYPRWLIWFPNLRLKIHPQEVSTARSYPFLTFEVRACTKPSGYGSPPSKSQTVLTWNQGGTHWGLWPGPWPFRRARSHRNCVLRSTLQLRYIQRGPTYVREDLRGFNKVLRGNLHLISPVLPGRRA